MHCVRASLETLTLIKRSACPRLRAAAAATSQKPKKCIGRAVFKKNWQHWAGPFVHPPPPLQLPTRIRALLAPRIEGRGQVDLATPKGIKNTSLSYRPPLYTRGTRSRRRGDKEKGFRGRCILWPRARLERDGCSFR